MLDRRSAALPRRYGWRMLSPLVQTLVGGGLAIVGGLLAAWWQTSRADDIARRIRLAERREAALLALQATVMDVYDRVADIHRTAVESGQTTFQYVAALAALRELSQLWLGVSSGAISDPNIVASYNALDAAARERLPSGKQALDYMASNVQQAGVTFTGDLEYVLGFLRQFKDEVRAEVSLIISPRRRHVVTCTWRAIGHR